MTMTRNGNLMNERRAIATIVQVRNTPAVTKFPNRRNIAGSFENSQMVSRDAIEKIIPMYFSGKNWLKKLEKRYAGRATWRDKKNPSV